MAKKSSAEKTNKMKLLIVESPAKAKTIAGYLNEMKEPGVTYKVVASVGHVRDLPKNNKKAIDIEHGFTPHYEISAGKEKVIAEIKHLAKEADEVILATDPDREGEAIAWHIKEAVGLKNPKRVVFHEITKDAVQEAIKHPRDIDDNLKQAQEARRVLDRLVGYDLSGLIWKKVRYGLSAGRVQSPALRILMEREREIRAFIPETYFAITANTHLGKNSKEVTVFNCAEEPRDKKEAERIVELGNNAAKKNEWTITDVAESEVKRSPKAPFITSTLQQAASSRLGFSPSRTMGLAQRLYESGYITYMRTDSPNLSKVAIGQTATYIEKEYGKNYLQIRAYASKSKNAQEAHEAIRPTNMSALSLGADESQKKLYELIWARTVASQMKDALLSRTKITANISDSFLKSQKEKEIPDFSVTGSRIMFDGWLKADPGARGEDVILPQVKKNESLDVTEVISEQKQTEPPSRYSEAGLIKELEKRGIGRPSTYAAIIKTIEERGYVEKINKSLKPTDTGDVVSSFLESNFTDYISDSFTAEMEDKLDNIADGKAEYIKTLSDFYGPFLKDVKAKDKIEKLTNLGDADPKFTCPKCGSAMVIKLSRGGKFVSCSRFPECDGALTIDGQQIKRDEPLGKDPETGMDIFVKIGRFGPYVQLGDGTQLEEVEKVSKKGKVTKKKVKAKPKMASIPKTVKPEEVTIEQALTYLTLPRDLGKHPVTGKKIVANVGRFGPYIMHDGDFRSLKTDNVYTITTERALAILAEEKKVRRGGFKKKENS